MVLAIGDLAGATFVTLLAATATQFARAGRLWTLCTIEIEVAVRLGWSGMALAIDDRAPAGECRAGRLWTLCTIEIELPCGWAGREWPRHRRPSGGGGPVGRDGGVTLLLADFVTFNQIHGMSA